MSLSSWDVVGRKVAAPPAGLALHLSVATKRGDEGGLGRSSSSRCFSVLVLRTHSLGHIVICCGGLFCACYGINVTSGFCLLVPLALPFSIMTIKNILTLLDVPWAGEQNFLFPALQVN